MDIKKTTNDVVQHVKKHKEAYIVGALGVLGIVVTVVIMRNHGAVNHVNASENSGAQLILFDKAKVENFNFYSPGNGRNVIHDTTTGAIYPSQKVAAQALGVSHGSMSNHINGRIPDLKEHVLEKIVDGVTEYELVRH